MNIHYTQTFNLNISKLIPASKLKCNLYMENKSERIEASSSKPENTWIVYMEKRNNSISLNAQFCQTYFKKKDEYLFFALRMKPFRHGSIKTIVEPHVFL